MEIADVDGNGTIDKAEFKDMIQKLDESIAETKIDEIFASCDGNGDAELSQEDFGKALYEAVSLMKHDEGEDHE